MGMDGRSTGERQSGEREETRGEWVDGFLVVRASSSFVSLEKRSPNERFIQSFIHSRTHSLVGGWWCYPTEGTRARAMTTVATRTRAIGGVRTRENARRRRSWMSIARVKAGDGDETGADDDDERVTFLGRAGKRTGDAESIAKRYEEREAEVLRANAGMQYEFGKPQSPKETWEPFAREARVGLAEEYRRGAEGDAVAASLHVAVEDDAFEGRTSVCLPREAYFKRVDKLVNEFVQRDLSYMSDEEKADGDAMIAAVERFLYEEQKYRTPTGWREAFSPYRTYFHNVIAQKVGIPATLAAIYIGFLARLKQRGELDACGDINVTLRVRRGADTTPRRPRGIKASDPVPDGSVVCTADMVVRMQLMALKRAFWPWEWDDARDSGFLLAVEAAAYGKDDRMNTAAGVVGIIQPSGRPFGNLPMALLVTERLAELDGNVGFQQRDMAILLYHGGYRRDALDALVAFNNWRATTKLANVEIDDTTSTDTPQPEFAWESGDPVAAARLALREDEALAKVVLELNRDLLERQFDV